MGGGGNPREYSIEPYPAKLNQFCFQAGAICYKFMSDGMPDAVTRQDGRREPSGRGRALALTGDMAEGGMPSFSRYVMRQLTVATLLIACVLTGLILLVRSLRLIDYVINLGVSLASVLKLAALLAPSILAVLLPIAAFVAIAFTYNRMVSDRELVVMRAAGVSQFQLAGPAMRLAFLVLLVGYALNLYLTPLSYRAFKDLQFAYRNNFAGVLLREGRFNTPIDGVTVYVRARESTGELLGVLVHDKRNRQQPVTWMAERGMLVTSEGTPQMIMFNGNRQEVDETSGRLSLVDFDRVSYDLDILDQALSTRRLDPKERFLPDLLNPSESSTDQFYADELRAEGHQRLSNPLYALAFAMIALASLLSGDFNRRGQTRRILTAILLVMLLQVGGIGLSNWAAHFTGLIPLMYGVPVVAILGSAYMLSRYPRRPRLHAGLAPAETG